MDYPDYLDAQQFTVDDILRQYIKLLADEMRLCKHREAVDLLENQFIEQYGKGLFIDNPQRPILASKWAALMDSQFNTRQYSRWLKYEPYLTGRYFGLHVILFPLLDDNELPTGLTAYQLTGDRFGESDREGAKGYFKTDPLSIELDAKGDYIPDAKHIEATPKETRQWQAQMKELWSLKDTHKGNKKNI